MSSKRALTKITKMSYKHNPDPKISKGKVVFDMNEEDIKEISELEENEQIDSDVFEKASQVATVGAVLEQTFKAGALANALVNDDEHAFEKLKSKLGVSGSDASYQDVNLELDKAIRYANEQKKELENLESKMNKLGKEKAKEGDDSGSESEQDE